MCSSDKFNVRWNNYHTVLQLSFPKLLTNEHFVDVTLTCEGRSIRCHKMVLSACSSYFEQLLTESPCQHPIIFLKDMKFWEVEALVDFMYKGEVSVSQDKLASLVQAAESLQIKGLAGSQTQDSAERVTTKSVRDRLLSRTERKIDSPPPKRKRRTMTDDRKMLPANLPDLEMIPLPRASVPVAVLCKPEVNSNSQSETVNHSEEISEDTAPTLYPNSPTEEESDVFTAMKIKDENFSTNEDQEDGISNDDEGNEENMELIQMGQGDGINMADPLNTGAGPSSEDRPQVTKPSSVMKKAKNRSSVMNKWDTVNLVEVVYSCDTGIAETEEDNLSEVEVAVLLTPGPYTTIRYLRRYISVLRGAHLNHVHALFNKLACKGFGACYAVERTLVFFKKPTQQLGISTHKLIEPWVDSYKDAYQKRNTAISNLQDEKLKSLHPFLQGGLWNMNHEKMTKVENEVC